MIIGFSGPAGAGKSTAAEVLVQRHGFTRLRFAAPLKNMLRAILPGDDINEWIEGALKETVHPLLGCTPRHAMQTLGTEWGRQCIGPDLWVNLARENILHCPGDVVFDDVRFKNEVDLIHEFGGIVIEIRPKFITHKMNHISEAGVEADKWVYNDGSIEDMARKLGPLAK